MMTLVAALALAQAAPGSRESLEAAIRAFHDGMAKESERLKTLKAMLPTREDADLLLPGAGEKLWPRLEATFADMEKNLDKVAQEVIGKGPLKSVELKDVRAEMEWLPKGTPVFNCVKRFENGSAGSGSYVFLRNRWILVRGLSSWPEILQKLK
jgi:hypothetical protein